jgi:O-6-methylguanine DNA methyltransferase
MRSFINLKDLRQKISCNIKCDHVPQQKYLWHIDTDFGPCSVVHDDLYIYKVSIDLFTKSLDYGFMELRSPSSYSHMGIALCGTDFQVKVWDALIRLSFERSIFSYEDVASYIGSPKSSRAVGNAVSKNPIAYLVPCHRVVRKDRSIGGFAWGVDLKKRMLDYDKAI